MRRAYIKASLAAAVAITLQRSKCLANVVIGNWSNETPDGWFDANYTEPTGLQPEGPLPSPPWYYSNPTGGANAWGGDSLLFQPKGSTGQNEGLYSGLTTKLEDRSLMGSWWANNAIQITMTYPSAASASSTSGYSMIYDLFVDASGWGFSSIGGNPVPASVVTYSAGTTQTTLTFDVPYTAVLTAMSNAGYNATNNQGYAEIVLATLSTSGAPASVYFDQVSLITVPEPSAGILCLAAVAGGLLKRRISRGAT